MICDATTKERLIAKQTPSLLENGEEALEFLLECALSQVHEGDVMMDVKALERDPCERPVRKLIFDGGSIDERDPKTFCDEDLYDVEALDDALIIECAESDVSLGERMFEDSTCSRPRFTYEELFVQEVFEIKIRVGDLCVRRANADELFFAEAILRIRRCIEDAFDEGAIDDAFLKKREQPFGIA